MSYHNKHKLMVLKPSILSSEPSMQCRNCMTHYPLDAVYCSKCGNMLGKSSQEVEVKDIIKLFRAESASADYLINNSGGVNETGSGNIKEDLIIFSKSHPTALFQLDITWDQGFGDPPSRYYVQNGKIQESKTKLVYDEFDSNKLK